MSELLADLAAGNELLPAELEAERVAGRGAWAPDVLAEDARRLAEFMRLREGVPWDEIRLRGVKRDICPLLACPHLLQ